MFRVVKALWVINPFLMKGRGSLFNGKIILSDKNYRAAMAWCQREIPAFRLAPVP
jgi:hypothetical protein